MENLDIMLSAYTARVSAEDFANVCKDVCDMLENRTFPRPSDEVIEAARLEWDDALTAFYRARTNEENAHGVWCMLCYFCG
jgi:hypothetical protein